MLTEQGFLQSKLHPLVAAFMHPLVVSSNTCYSIMHWNQAMKKHQTTATPYIRFKAAEENSQKWGTLDCEKKTEKSRENFTTIIVQSDVKRNDEHQANNVIAIKQMSMKADKYLYTSRAFLLVNIFGNRVWEFLSNASSHLNSAYWSKQNRFISTAASYICTSRCIQSWKWSILVIKYEKNFTSCSIQLLMHFAFLYIRGYVLNFGMYVSNEFRKHRYNNDKLFWNVGNSYFI